jgi:hypothetical protein
VASGVGVDVALGLAVPIAVGVPLGVAVAAPLGMAVGIAPALDVLAGVGEAPELAVEVARALGDGVTFGELEIPGVGDGNVKSVVFFSHAASARNAVAAQNAPPSAR